MPKTFAGVLPLNPVEHLEREVREANKEKQVKEYKREMRKE